MLYQSVLLLYQSVFCYIKVYSRKRVNFGLRGSYKTRCNAAVVAFNTHEPISRLSYILGTKPGEIAVQLENIKKVVYKLYVAQKTINEKKYKTCSSR